MHQTQKLKGSHTQQKERHYVQHTVQYTITHRKQNIIYKINEK